MPKNANKNLRDWEPTESDAKHVDDTKMLSTTARESRDHNESNSTKEHIVSHPAYGPLGVNGRK